MNKLLTWSGVLTEEEVVEAVCRYLMDRGYSIIERATTTQHGDDIVASNGTAKLIIEAKGAGSSKVGTSRFGQEFSSGQVFDHVAKALLKALRVVSSNAGRAGVALPDNETHRREVEKVVTALRQVGVGVFWVSDELQVRFESPWAL